MTRDHHHEIEIDASADDVWRAISDGAELTRWYADRATVTPGEGGIVAVGWEGEDDTVMEGTSRIDVWEPGARLRLVDLPPEDSAGFPKLEEPTVQEWTIVTEGGATVLRLVHSGFPETDDWDGIYDSTDHGWDVFLLSLRHYLERHPGQPRRAIVATAALDLDPATAWNALRAACGVTGDRFEAKLPAGEALSGTVVLERPGKVLLASVDELDGGLLFVTLEMGTIWASLAAFGTARTRLDGLGDRWRDWMINAPSAG
ncbi:SRPBCC domain-containing protein [Actinomadura sp. 9N407]|uniref:SRPBCC domain-containing protein n=1 Tax=Actinomadura sp. 9N407 TaxID=3375154 RepID=UPI0037AB2817